MGMGMRKRWKHWEEKGKQMLFLESNSTIAVLCVYTPLHFQLQSYVHIDAWLLTRARRLAAIAAGLGNPRSGG